MSYSVILWLHSLHTALCVLQWCMHSWPVRQTIVSQQPLKNSSLLFMLNCISGISLRSRDSLVCCCTQYQTEFYFPAVVGLFCIHQRSQETIIKIKGQLGLFLASALFFQFLTLFWSVCRRFHEYIYKTGTVWIVHHLKWPDRLPPRITACVVVS